MPPEDDEADDDDDTGAATPHDPPEIGLFTLSAVSTEALAGAATNEAPKTDEDEEDFEDLQSAHGAYDWPSDFTFSPFGAVLTIEGAGATSSSNDATSSRPTAMRA